MKIRQIMITVGITIASCLLLQGCQTMNGLSQDLGMSSSGHNSSRDRSYSSNNSNNLFFWGDTEPRRQQNDSRSHSRSSSYTRSSGSQSSGNVESGESYSIGNYTVGGNTPSEGVVQAPVSVAKDVGQTTEKVGEAVKKPSIQDLPKGL